MARKLKQTREALELRRRARERLLRLGYTEGAIRGTPGLIAAVEFEVGREAGDDPQGLLDEWMDVVAPPKQEASAPYVGQIVPPTDRNKLRGEYKPDAGYLANVERARAAQPKVRALVSNAYRPGEGLR